ncbi:hypothetical protein FE773_09035 [Caminibacter mediatlanticus TB-2]|uniref:CRISPR system Cms protein Csm4 n=1 Tax=Caminibacter mediatlanticus TB-2 TaxID=391592 RepID=A0ABX5VDU3_9BACT|nr:hypothetical protein [Caminibacter mediatlanticus]QCT95331.1 hypothetical protein FE773_09035 [Caminibacter mediatlanticus TB-2]
MELLVFKIKPLTPFCFDLRGDSIFSHIVAYDYLEGGNLFDNYLEKVNLIVSDMMPFKYVYKPTLPFRFFKHCVNEEDKKKLKKKNWINIKDLQYGNLCKVEDVNFKHKQIVVRNSINRLSFSTDDEGFSPYSNEEISVNRNLWMFCLVDKNIKDKVIELVKKLGKYGIGKDVSIGKGKFEVEVLENDFIEDIKSNYYLTLSPAIIDGYESYYLPFVRFGKYGLDRAFKNPFKKPVLLADSGAVIKSNKKIKFIGKAITNNQSEDKKSFFQGYSIVIPFKLKDE